MTVLHVGCGGSPLPEWFAGMQEFRVDADPEHSPDHVASMTALGEIGTYDVVYCSHALEHVGDPLTALREFRRCTKPGGFVQVIVPDTQDVQDNDEVLFVSPWGPITGHHLLWGLEDMPYMAHLSRFTQANLSELIEQAGFDRTSVHRLPNYNLMAIGVA